MWYLTLLGLCIVSGSVNGQHCYLDWVYHADSCYGFGEEPLTWADAQDMCRSFDSTLAEISDSEESSFLKALARPKAASGYWLGGTDIFHEGVWLWVSSRENISYTDWATGEPNNADGHEDCVVMNKDSGYQWNDILCDAKYNFICETRPLENVIVG